jgi:ribonuclease R
VSLKSEIVAALGARGEGLSEAELLKGLGLPKHLKRKVLDDLQALVAEGKVVKNARHRYRAAAYAREGAAPASGGLLQAEFVLTGGGRSFAKVPGTAMSQDFVVPERMRGWALPGDLVEIKPLPAQKGFRGQEERRAGAEVKRVVKRGREQWVGRLGRHGSEAFCNVRLGELDLELEVTGVPAQVKDDDWVVVSAPGLDLDGREPTASKYLSRVGDDGTAHLDTLILIKKAGLKEDFDPSTLAEAAALAPEPPEADKAADGRLDLRHLTLFTIDGADAKDFDDAVSLERQGDGWVLGVHIADVAHYVRPGSALDKEAYERATSVYLPDRVLPMLPEALSNGLCSLKPDVDRLSMSALMTLDAKGAVRGTRFANSVIHSRRRFTYEEIQAWFDGQAPLRPGEDRTLGPTLRDMQQVARLRRALREERGALDFDFPETKVTLDAQGLPTELYRKARIFTHQLIEEFMLAANEAVATELREAGLPVLYRIHEEPDADKLDDTLAFLGKLKIGGPKGGAATPKDLQRLLARAASSPQQRLIQTLILRSLRLAKYSPIHTMHFGLALEDYCHFTSPIRRYPDLVIHRLLKARIAGKTPAQAKAIVGDLGLTGEQSSTMERKAEACERECIKAKQIRYLEARLGQTFPATVVSVAQFGFFCEIDPFPADGLVSLGSLGDDYYDYDAANYCLTGSRKKRKISIGDKLWVKVKRADWETLQVDFEALWTDPDAKAAAAAGAP